MSVSLQREARSVGAQSPIVCSRCEYELPLRLAASGEQAAVWLCVECGMPLAAVCIPSVLHSLSHRVALDDRYFDDSYLPPVTPETRAEMVRLSSSRERQSGYKNHRRSERVAMALPTTAVELDREFYPISPTFQMMVTNISSEGICLVSKCKVAAPYLAAKLRSSYRAEPIQVIIDVKRREDLKSPFREIGGEFLLRLGSRPV